jgi:hypothetical protein
LGPIRRGAAFESFPFFFGAGELLLFVSFVAAASFVTMLIKALATTSAFALGMINSWGLCHFFL